MKVDNCGCGSATHKSQRVAVGTTIGADAGFAADASSRAKATSGAAIGTRPRDVSKADATSGAKASLWD